MMSDDTDPVVGHKTYRDGPLGFRHEPLRQSEAEAIMAAVDAATKRRAELMPDEQAAIRMMFEARQRLMELGWNDAIYCPKDGSEFDAIEAGSTGIHRCHYSGEWPSGSWWIAGDGDLYPSRPVLYRKKPETMANGLTVAETDATASVSGLTPNDRGTGRTTQQMNAAPPGAVFVWCNGALYYAQTLARKLGRDDLTVRPLSWLQPCNVMGRDFSGVVLDHAARPSTEALEALHYVRVRSAAAGRKTPNAEVSGRTRSAAARVRAPKRFFRNRLTMRHDDV